MTGKNGGPAPLETWPAGAPPGDPPPGGTPPGGARPGGASPVGTTPDRPIVGPEVDRDLPVDAHLHTDLSPDSNVPLDAYCWLALERGISELVITDHLDFDPDEPAFAHADFPTRERTVREASERWADRGLAIRLGVEITYESRREQEIREYLARHPYDFAIGSVHVGRHSTYTASRVAGWIAGRSFPEIVAPYFAEVVAAARSGLFDTIGHLDYVKKYLAAHLPPAAFAAAPEVYEAPLAALVESGTGLEVNSSGLRQASREPYPAPWVVARYRALGGTVVTAGSDAHHTRSFAHGLAHAYRIAAKAGFAEVAIRRSPGEARASERVAIPASVTRGAGRPVGGP
jgi:histidinol-phosphatase (PHP family)